MTYNCSIYAQQKDSNAERKFYEEQSSKYCRFNEVEGLFTEISNPNNLPTGYENVYPARLIGLLDYIQFKQRPTQHISHYALKKLSQTPKT